MVSSIYSANFNLQIKIILVIKMIYTTINDIYRQMELAVVSINNDKACSG